MLLAQAQPTRRQNVNASLVRVGAIQRIHLIYSGGAIQRIHYSLSRTTHTTISPFGTDISAYNLKMNRLFAASLLVVLLATPTLAMGPDPSRRLQSKVGYASTTCSDTISYIFHIDVAGCLAPCPVHVHVETHCFTFLPSCALPFLDSHQFASSSLETQTNLSPPRAPRRPRGRKLRRLQRVRVASTTANAS